MTTLKEMFTGEWVIIRVKQGGGGVCRVDARRRFHRADLPDFASKWGSVRYVNLLSMEKFEKPITKLGFYEY